MRGEGEREGYREREKVRQRGRGRRERGDIWREREPIYIGGRRESKRAVRRYEQLETSPETIEPELRPAVCERRLTDRHT